MIKKFQSGVTLVESLVAVVVLSIGLFGIVGLQTAALKYEQRAWVRSAVSGSISDIADRIRANGGAEGLDYKYEVDYDTQRAAIDGGSEDFVPAVDCRVSACGVNQLAQYDIAGWRRVANDQLPAVATFLTSAGSKGENLAFRISLAWADKDARLDLGGSAPPPAPICENITTSAGASARNCCPRALAVPDGTSCITMNITP